MGKATLVIGRLRGIQIGINASWLVIFGLVVWTLADVVFPASEPGLAGVAYIAMAVIAALLFFGSLLLHELGHALQAERENMRIEGITLWIFGGVARFSGMFPSAGAELRVALAGPGVTFVIAALMGGLAQIPGLPSAVDGVVGWLAVVNLVLGLFNLLPAFPMDGGRVLRALVWRSTGDFSKATQTAGAWGAFFGRFFILMGLAEIVLLSSPGGLWLALIGWFVIVAGRAELQLARIRGGFAGMTVADLMVRNPQTAAAEADLRGFIADVVPRGRFHAYPVIGQDGAAIGLLPIGGQTLAATAGGQRVSVGDRMVPLGQALVLAPAKDLGDAALELMQTHSGRALVIEGSRLAGLLSLTDVLRWLELAPALADGAARA